MMSAWRRHQFVTSTQTARTRLALTFVLVKRVLRVTVKHVKVKLKRNMEPYGKHHMLLTGAKTFILRCTILIPLTSNGYLITKKKTRFPYFLFWGWHEAVGISFVNWIFNLVPNNHKLIIADNDLDTADDDNDDNVKETSQDINYFSGVWSKMRKRMCLKHKVTH